MGYLSFISKLFFCAWKGVNESSVYSKNLIDRITAYYKRRGVSLTPEQAEEYLNSLADLYESFIEFAKIPWTPETT